MGICINYTLCGAEKTMAAAIKIPNLAHSTVMGLFIYHFSQSRGREMEMDGTHTINQRK